LEAKFITQNIIKSTLQELWWDLPVKKGNINKLNYFKKKNTHDELEGSPYSTELLDYFSYHLKTEYSKELLTADIWSYLF
jgi:hypothetical protein